MMIRRHQRAEESSSSPFDVNTPANSPSQSDSSAEEQLYVQPEATNRGPFWDELEGLKGDDKISPLLIEINIDL